MLLKRPKHGSLLNSHISLLDSCIFGVSCKPHSHDSLADGTIGHMKTGQETAVMRSIQIYSSRKTQQFKAYALLMLHQKYYLHIQRLIYNYKGQKCKEHGLMMELVHVYY